MTFFHVMDPLTEPGIGVIGELTAEVHGDLAAIEGTFDLGDGWISAARAGASPRARVACR